MRRRVKTTYQQAGSTPSSRQRRSHKRTDSISGAVDHQSTPLARYIAENEDSGISVSELMEQFQELDCEHKGQSVLASTAEKKIVKCEDCGKVTTIIKPVSQ